MDSKPAGPPINKKRVAHLGTPSSQTGKKCEDFISDIMKSMDSTMNLENSVSYHQVESLQIQKKVSSQEDDSKPKKFRKFIPEKSYPLLAKSKKRLKSMKHVVSIPKQNAHMKGAVLRECKSSSNEKTTPRNSVQSIARRNELSERLKGNTSFKMYSGRAIKTTDPHHKSKIDKKSAEPPQFEDISDRDSEPSVSEFSDSEIQPNSQSNRIEKSQIRSKNNSSGSDDEFENFLKNHKSVHENTDSYSESDSALRCKGKVSKKGQKKRKKSSRVQSQKRSSPAKVSSLSKETEYDTESDSVEMPVKKKYLRIKQAENDASEDNYSQNEDLHCSDSASDCLESNPKSPEDVPQTLNEKEKATCILPTSPDTSDDNGNSNNNADTVNDPTPNRESLEKESVSLTSECHKGPKTLVVSNEADKCDDLQIPSSLIVNLPSTQENAAEQIGIDLLQADEARESVSMLDVPNSGVELGGEQSTHSDEERNETCEPILLSDFTTETQLSEEDYEQPFNITIESVISLADPINVDSSVDTTSKEHGQESVTHTAVSNSDAESKSELDDSDIEIIDEPHISNPPNKLSSSVPLENNIVASVSSECSQREENASEVEDSPNSSDSEECMIIEIVNSNRSSKSRNQTQSQINADLSTSSKGESDIVPESTSEVESVELQSSNTKLENNDLKPSIVERDVGENITEIQIHKKLKSNPDILNTLDKIGIGNLKDILQQVTSTDTSCANTSENTAFSSENSEKNNSEQSDKAGDIKQNSNDTEIPIILHSPSNNNQKLVPNVDIDKVKIPEIIELDINKSNDVKTKFKDRHCSSEKIDFDISKVKYIKNEKKLPNVVKSPNTTAEEIKESVKPSSQIAKDAIKTEIDKFASANILDMCNSTHRKSILDLRDLYKKEFQRYKEIVCAEQNVSSGLKLLENNQRQKLQKIKLAIKSFASMDPCFLNIVKQESNMHTIKSSNCNNAANVESTSKYKDADEPDRPLSKQMLELTQKILQSEDKSDEPLPQRICRLLRDSKCIMCGKKAVAACQGCAKVFFCSENCGIKYWNNGHNETCGT